MKMLGCVVILASVLTACLAAYAQISEVEVQIGDTVILPCNISVYSREELDVRWEAMGKDVVFFQKGQLVVGQGYEGRVEIPLSKALEGDFSLTLTNAVMSDTDLYECLWQGKRSVSTVSLNVLSPQFPELHTSVTEGETVTLPCYGRIPKNKPWEKIFIQWLKDDEEILLFSSGKISTNTSYRDLALPSQEEISWGIYSLTILSVRASDQGVYNCRYKANDYEAPRNGVPETYSLSVLEPDDMQPTVEKTSDATHMTSFGTSTELAGLTTDASEDLTTIPDTQRVISELLQQQSTTTDTTVLIADTSADSTTVQDTVRATAVVISQMLPQPSTTTDLIGLLADSNVDITTARDTVEVISELLPQPSTSTANPVLIAHASADSTTVQDTVRATAVVISQMQQPSTTTDLIGLLADSNVDSTTVQDTVEVISELLPQPSTSTGNPVLIADASADSTTVQDTVRATAVVISQMLPQPSTTTDLIGLLADSNVDSTTAQDTVEELLSQPSTSTGNPVLIADASADSTTVQDTVRPTTIVISQMQQPSMTTDLIGLLADSSVDGTTGQDTMEVIPELLQQPSTTADFIKLIADSSEDSTTLQDTVGGEKDPFEYVWDENVPWVRIGIISVVLLVTAVFLGTLVALGKF